MQALLPHFTDRKLRQGPFFYELSDLHQNSIFVDSESHMKCLVDLEWACMFGTCSVLHIGWLACLWTFWRARTSVLSQKRKTNFWRYLKKKRSHFHLMVWLFISDKLHEKKKGWTIGNFWYFHALESPKGLYNLFLGHIQPRYASFHREDLDLMASVICLFRFFCVSFPVEDDGLTLDWSVRASVNVYLTSLEAALSFSFCQASWGPRGQYNRKATDKTVGLTYINFFLSHKRGAFLWPKVSKSSTSRYLILTLGVGLFPWMRGCQLISQQGCLALPAGLVELLCMHKPVNHFTDIGDEWKKTGNVNSSLKFHFLLVT